MVLYQRGWGFSDLHTTLSQFWARACVFGFGRDLFGPFTTLFYRI